MKACVWSLLAITGQISCCAMAGCHTPPPPAPLTAPATVPQGMPASGAPQGAASAAPPGSTSSPAGAPMPANNRPQF